MAASGSASQNALQAAMKGKKGQDAYRAFASTVLSRENSCCTSAQAKVQNSGLSAPEKMAAQGRISSNCQHKYQPVEVIQDSYEKDILAGKITNAIEQGGKMIDSFCNGLNA